MSSHGFVDLRLNQQDQGEESFWPSFTDIMMVIVMIFLLAMVILLTRNMELVHQLQSSLKAEKQASLQAQSTSHQNSTLNQRLQALEKETDMMRLKLMDLSDEHEHTLSQLAASQSSYASIRDNYAQLQQKQIQSMQNNLAFQTQVQNLDDALMQANTTYLALQHQYQVNQHDLLHLQTTHQNSVQRLNNLEQAYTGLEKKYQRLIRPARSSKGRYVVQVRYQKTKGHLSIDMKTPNDIHFTSVSAMTMHKRLANIQEKHARNLYVKIIFPEESGLSYNEAWKITESLLRMYDYYYQEKP
ncbi:MAG: hypothetical protein Q9M15_06250 [Mariprofundaceae bacterium]|nr:hypothetical protein [Mariprofundaceae bacterium]